MVGLLLCSGSAQAYQISSFFDITYDLSQGPPYPPIDGVVASVGTSNLPFAPIEKISLKVNNVTPVIQTRMVASDSGGGLGSPGVNSFFDVFTGCPDDDFELLRHLHRSQHRRRRASAHRRHADGGLAYGLVLRRILGSGCARPGTAVCPNVVPCSGGPIREVREPYRRPDGAKLLRRVS